MLQTPCPVADCHIHSEFIDGSIWQWGSLLRNREEYLAYLAQCGIDFAIHSSASATQAQTVDQLRAGNAHTLSLRGDDHVRLFPAAIVHPAFLDQLGETLDAFRAAGSAWAGEMCPYVAGWDMTHANVIPLVQLLGEAGFIFQMHEQPASDLQWLVSACPGTTIVISHLGGRHEMQAKFELAQAHENLWLDICGSGHERLGMIEDAVARGLEDRLLYGSDFPINEPAGPVVRILQGRFTEGVRRKILRENLFRLMREHGMTVR